MLVLVLVDLVNGAVLVVGLIDLGEALSSRNVELAFAVVDSGEDFLAVVVFSGDTGDTEGDSGGWKNCSSSGVIAALGGVMQNSSLVVLRNFLFLRYLSPLSVCTRYDLGPTF